MNERINKSEWRTTEVSIPRELEEEWGHKNCGRLLFSIMECSFRCISDATYYYAFEIVVEEKWEDDL